MKKDIEKRYWKSLDEFVDTEKYNEEVEKEFLRSPLSEEEASSGVARRDFLKLMGASLALSSAACVRRPVQHIVPYAKRPEHMIPGKADYYASSVYDQGEAFGVIVKTREGRPIKMEGNPDFPVNKGGLSARMQAHVVSLYDPDRLKKSRIRIPEDKDFHKRIWDEVDYDKMDEVVSKVIASGKLGMITSSTPSSSMKSVIKDFSNTFGVRNYTYDSISHEEITEGQKQSYGMSVTPRYRLEKAKYIISVGADFLGTYGSPVENAKGFAKNRTPSKEMSRLVVFESLMSLTGANADYRVRVKSSNYIDVLMGLAAEIVLGMGKSTYASNASVKKTLSGFTNVASKLGIEEALFKRIAKDLWDHRGESLVVAGGMSAKTEKAVDLQNAANFLNSLLGNDGKSVDYVNSGKHFEGSAKDLQSLIEDVENGKIDTLIVQGLNLAYLAPKGMKLAQALKKVTLIYSTMYQDETAELADFVLAESHPLEEWNDWEFLDGLYSIQQPTIRPLANTRPLPFNLMTWAYTLEKGPKQLKDFESWYEYVQWNWKNKIAAGRTGGKSFSDFWDSLLQKGFLDTKSSSRNQNASARTFRTTAISNIRPSESTTRGSFELNLYPTIGLGDGSYANLPWLQEFPDPVTKVVWDNYLSVSYKTAKENSLKDGDMVKVQVGDTQLELPAFVQIGQEDGTLGIAVGYGKASGSVAKGVGQNANVFADWNGKLVVTAGLEASFKKTGKFTELANTQGHHHMEGRMIVAETTLENYLKDMNSGIHRHKVFSIWPKHEYSGHKWGMSIDQNSCIGCSACVIACQSENNVPVVGKQYVIEGREMHWIRIDRYYSGSDLHHHIDENPDVYFQPQLCQHCDNAPCETVCPVLATTHSDEGLNEMTYNRCVGTRYCSNNCPYKARRFNWFAYTKGDRDLDTPAEAYNSSVTVRSRGVMEKCTFCIQRITEAKDEARQENRSLKDGDIVTACEQSCPTDAIVFGDMNDKNSRVSKLHAKENSYKVLEEVFAEPSVRYLTKVRNKDSVTTGSKGGH